MSGAAATFTDGLSTATRITEAVCGLPAVATLDWADRAAGCLTPIGADPTAVVLIATVEPGGTFASHEAVGVMTRRVAEGEPASEEERTTDLTLRSRVERLTETGLTLSETQRSAGFVGSLDQVLGAGWPTAGLGELWGGLGVGGVLMGVSRLGSIDAGRVLIAMLGFREGAASHCPSAAGVLAVTMPLLTRRALLAIGPRRATAARWLTSREQQVLSELTLGKSVREIAGDLDRSPHTIHDHVKSLHRKLNASSRGELIARALGFLDESSKIRERHVLQPQGEERAAVVAGTEDEAPAPEITTRVAPAVPGQARPLYRDGREGGAGKPATPAAQTVGQPAGPGGGQGSGAGQVIGSGDRPGRAGVAATRLHPSQAGGGDDSSPISIDAYRARSTGS